MRFLATNTDATYPIRDGVVVPGSGTYVAAIATASGKKPELVFGKPSIMMLEQIIKDYDLDRSKTVMVGDRLDTDIVFGHNGNIKTLLVLTGVSKLHDLEHHEVTVKPDFIAPSVGSLYDALWQ